VLFDDNKISIDGPTSLTTSEDTLKRFEASGWNTIAIDGHNHDAISAALTKAKQSDKPTVIACRTTIAYGAPTKAGTSASHGSPLGKSEIEGARSKLGWAHGEFEVPDALLQAWRAVGARGAVDYKAWEKQLAALDGAKLAEFERMQAGELPAGFNTAVQDLKKKLAESKPNEATRKSSENALEALVPVMPELLGGSADLTGSNNTKTKPMKPVNEKDFSGSYMYYGVREHAMGAVMNGVALHGGFIPYGGTFLVFTDYCRPAIRLSALMEQRVIYVMTHDSIGLGEDGPTHQPVEHLASLRAIPNLNVFRPADATETAECWALALSQKNTPSILSLTRQNVPTLRNEYTPDNLCARGGYVISDAKDAKVTIMATGSEVSLAVNAQKMLAAKGIAAKVVSMVCWELFDAQTPAYREGVLGKDTLKVAVEAAIKFGWERYIGVDGIFIGMPGFGASAPAPDLYKHFGITAENLAAQVVKKIG
jgi:transketolase